jgi:hypothetical protein
VLVERGVLTLIVIVLMLTVLWGVVIGLLDRPSKRRLSGYWRRRGTGESLTATAGRSPAAAPAPNSPLPVKAQPLRSTVADEPGERATHPATEKDNAP